jgi:hypothetical protein
MDLFMQHCVADGTKDNASVLIGSTDVGHMYALNSAGRLWSADGQVILLGSSPHFLATRFQLKTPSSVNLDELSFISITVHPLGQYIVIHALTVSLPYCEGTSHPPPKLLRSPVKCRDAIFFWEKPQVIKNEVVQ